MGTPAYMSPEQARGDEVDQRTDVWAFGCVLFEMLTGRRAITGRGTAETLANILVSTPDWTLLPHHVPAAVRQLLARCLEKDREHRLPGISPANLSIAQARDATSMLPWIGGLVVALAAVILVAQWAPWKQQSAGGESAASVAVLPFASFSQGKEDEYFADGLTEEVIHSLAQVSGLKVAARTSAFYFKGRNEDLRDVGRRLGVSHVVEGSVRREGNRMRMTAQLIKVADGFHLWSRTYERNVSDTFAVQTEIASAVAEALQLKLNPAADPVRERDPEAIHLELTARALMRRLGRQEITTARERFRQLTEIEPMNASAWAGFAHVTTRAAAELRGVELRGGHATGVVRDRQGAEARPQQRGRLAGQGVAGLYRLLPRRRRAARRCRRRLVPSGLVDRSEERRRSRLLRRVAEHPGTSRRGRDPRPARAWRSTPSTAWPS